MKFWHKTLVLPICVVSVASGLSFRRRGPRDDAARMDVAAWEQSMKYFHEPVSRSKETDDLLGHYDVRFFTSVLDYGKKRDVQVHLVQAYLETFKDLGLQTWIAHGTLLGWWWNQNMLPWDWDIDTQVTEHTLRHLAVWHNHTFYKHTATRAGHSEPVTATYLLDVNPHSAQRDHGDGFNVIDARWIDIETGLFIDITGISELDPKRPGVLSCKNFHEYQRSNIFPLRDTEFEGVEAKVPRRHAKLLIEEYGFKALDVEEYEGHRWDPARRLWTKIFDESPTLVKQEV